uniref:BZIP domain-containing protein n=1 Tax=Anopheles christyi TaxID=43041 RepID=A0A182K7D3_9DIPT
MYFLCSPHHPARPGQSLSRWHKQLSSSTNAAHGEKSCRRSRPSAAAPPDDQRGEETIFFYGGLVNRNDRNTYSPLESLLPHAASPLGLLTPTSPGLDSPPVDDDTTTAWMNTTTMLESCSPGGSDVPWWSSRTDTLFPAAGGLPGKGRVDVERTSATIGERSLADGRKTAANVCRIEFDKNRSFNRAETSVTVHDVCNKTSSGSGSSNSGSRNHDSSGGCGGQFSSGARSHVASGSCNGSGTVAAASSAGAHQHQSISPKKPTCDYSSISDSSNSNRGVSGGAVLTPLLPNIDWTNETCLGGGGVSDFTNTIVDDPRHLWLSSPTTSSSSNITDTELERSLDEYHHVRGPPKTTIETSIDCANLLDELHVELTQPALTLSPPVSLHEEIEQLSSAFDCDASNHLVSTAAAPTALPFVGLAADDTEPISLNILKWLQEDISSTILPERPHPELTATATELAESLLIDTGASAAGTFEQSLDQIHNITGLARLGNKTTTVGRRATTATAAVAATTSTTATPTETTHQSDNHPQRDHNYYAMKRRLQEEEENVGVKSKVPRLLHTTDGGWAASEETTFPTPATSGTGAASTSSKQQHLHVKLAATAAANAISRKQSLASRKATTLAVNVTPPKASPAAAPVQVPSTINGQALAALLQTTTTTTTSNHEPTPRVPPLAAAATLNTPDLTNDILDLEDEKFDLLSFIDTNDELLEFNSYHSTVEKKPTLDLLESPSVTSTTARPKASAGERRTNASKASSESKRDTDKQIYQLLTLDSLRQLTNAAEDVTSRAAGTASATTTSGRRTNASSSACSIGSMSSASSASSVCGDSSSDVSSSTKAPKRRGRPPKVAGTVRDRSQYQHLSEADWRYREQRDKNNEASRKSRINRKDRELKLEMEADRLNAQHQKLSYEERRLQQDCQRWRKAVMKLALL